MESRLGKVLYFTVEVVELPLSRRKQMTSFAGRILGLRDSEIFSQAGVSLWWKTMELTCEIASQLLEVSGAAVKSALLTERRGGKVLLKRRTLVILMRFSGYPDAGHEWIWRLPGASRKLMHPQAGSIRIIAMSANPHFRTMCMQRGIRV